MFYSIFGKTYMMKFDEIKNVNQFFFHFKKEQFKFHFMEKQKNSKFPFKLRLMILDNLEKKITFAVKQVKD